MAFFSSTWGGHNAIFHNSTRMYAYDWTPSGMNAIVGRQIA